MYFLYHLLLLFTYTSVRIFSKGQFHFQKLNNQAFILTGSQKINVCRHNLTIDKPYRVIHFTLIYINSAALIYTDTDYNVINWCVLINIFKLQTGNQTDQIINKNHFVIVLNKTHLCFHGLLWTVRHQIIARESQQTTVGQRSVSEAIAWYLTAAERPSLC